MKKIENGLNYTNKKVASNGKYCLVGEIPDFFVTSKNMFVVDLYCSNEDLGSETSYLKIIVRGSSDNNLFVDCYNIKDVTGNNSKNRLWGARAVKYGNSVKIYVSTKTNGESNILAIPFDNENLTYIPKMEYSDTFNIPTNYEDHIVGGWVLAR